MRAGYDEGMKRDNHPATTTPAQGTPPHPPALGDGLERESTEQIGWGDAVLNSFRTRLFHGFSADFGHDPALWAAVTRVVAHAIETFGSEEKAHRWLISSSGALGKESPYSFLKAGNCEAVDEELSRIDYGVYL